MPYGEGSGKGLSALLSSNVDTFIVRKEKQWSFQHILLWERRNNGLSNIFYCEKRETMDFPTYFIVKKEKQWSFQHILLWKRKNNGLFNIFYCEKGETMVFPTYFIVKKKKQWSFQHISCSNKFPEKFSIISNSNYLHFIEM